MSSPSCGHCPMRETIAKWLGRGHEAVVNAILCAVDDAILHWALEFESPILIELSDTYDFSVQEIFRLVFLWSGSMSGKNPLFRCFRDG